MTGRVENRHVSYIDSLFNVIHIISTLIKIVFVWIKKLN